MHICLSIDGALWILGLVYFVVIFKVYDSSANGKVTFDDMLNVLRDLTGQFISEKQREVGSFKFSFLFSFLYHLSGCQKNWDKEKEMKTNELLPEDIVGTTLLPESIFTLFNFYFYKKKGNKRKRRSSIYLSKLVVQALFFL